MRASPILLAVLVAWASAPSAMARDGGGGGRDSGGGRGGGDRRSEGGHADSRESRHEQGDSRDHRSGDRDSSRNDDSHRGNSSSLSHGSSQSGTLRSSSLNTTTRGQSSNSNAHVYSNTGYNQGYSQNQQSYAPQQAASPMKAAAAVPGQTAAAQNPSATATKLPAIPDVGVGDAAKGKPEQPRVNPFRPKPPQPLPEPAAAAASYSAMQRAESLPAQEASLSADVQAAPSAGLAAANPETPMLQSSENSTVALTREAPAKSARSREEDAKAARKAENYLKMHGYADAAEEATRVLQADPDNVAALDVRSEAYARLGRYAEAKADAERAVSLDPGDARAWRNKSWAELRLGNYQDAVGDATRAIQLDPRNAVNYAIRAYAKEMSGDRDGALEDMKVAAQLDPRYRGRLEAAQRGEKLYDPSMDDSYLLMDMVSTAGRSSPFNTLLRVLGGLFLLLGGGLLWLVFRKPRQAQGKKAGTWQDHLAQSMDARGVPMPQALGSQAEGKALLAGKYELLRTIGKGGMGDVYEGKDHSLNRTVAVKKLAERYASLDPQARERMAQEAKTVAAVHHPAIVQIYEVFEAEGALYLVFEYVQGKTVQQLLVETQTLPLDKAAQVLGPVCQALAHAHKQGLVHRDVKPANIMVTEAGHVKLMDFGIARSLGAAPSAAPKREIPRNATPMPVLVSAQYAKTATAAGTPLYTAPETEDGVVSKQADVYSLGVCLYEMLTGRPPFPPPASREQKANMDFLPPSLRVPELPAQVDELVLSALQPDPEKRLKTPDEFQARLEGALKAPRGPAT